MIATHGHTGSNMFSEEPELVTSEVNQFWVTRNRMWAMRLSAGVDKKQSLQMRRLIKRKAKIVDESQK